MQETNTYLSEISESEKATSSMIPLIQYSWKDKDTETRSVSGCQRLRAKGWFDYKRR